MQPQQKHTVRAVIFSPEGKLLLMERYKEDQKYYVLPGGHVENLEAPEQAMAREVKEETTLDISVANLLYTGIDGLGNQQKVYLCNYHGGEPVLPADSLEAMVDHQTDQLHTPRWFTTVIIT